MEKASLDQIMSISKTMRVLYVEDDKVARSATQTFLATVFKEVDIANDGEEGWQKYSDHDYDIIFTDINMPRLSGIRLIEKIREHDIKIPLFILSAYNDTEYFLESIKLGIDGYLLKPIQLDQFFITIAKIANKIRLEREVEGYQRDLERKVEDQTQELRYKYYHESNTNLFNALKLQEDMQKSRYDYMMLLDIANFSTINKEHGKRFADEVLVKTSRVLERHLHERSTLYKVESDRFVILLAQTSSREMRDFAQQIISFFDAKNVQMDDEVEISVTFNIGIAKVQEEMGQSIINCEFALEKSKSLGARHFEVFDDDIHCYSDEKESIRWLKNTREMVLGDRIIPYFQPIQNVESGDVFKYEVLARGEFEGEIIVPYYFLRSAEKLGYLTSITRMMINKSFEFFSKNGYEFSINITERDLLEGYLEEFLKEKLKLHSIDPSRVTFEILENVTVAKNSIRVAHQLNALKEMGFKIAIDDFGIENSNFSRLLEIKLDYIKIDAVFIRGLKESERNRTITRAIVNLAQTLGIKTIAEFVEDEDIYGIVKKCGIDYAQGYYIGRPEAALLER